MRLITNIFNFVGMIVATNFCAFYNKFVITVALIDLLYFANKYFVIRWDDCDDEFVYI